MVTRMLSRATLWPTGLAVLLAIVALAELLAPADSAPAFLPARVGGAAAAAPSESANLADVWSAAILARPIFRPDRRPLEAAPAAPTEMPRLTAIVITASGAAAIFQDSGGTAIAVKPGGTVDGEKVKSITAGVVTLTGPSGVTVLRPQFGAAPGDAPSGADAAIAPPPGAPSPPPQGFPPSPVPLASIPNNVDRF